MNKAIRTLGVSKLIEFVGLLKSVDSKSPIISIGSGLGTTESYIEKNADIEIICVDPNPESYQEPSTKFTEAHHPDYGTTTELIDSNPDIIENCNIILNWPTPNDKGNNYDMKAILDLKPRLILAICDSSGSGGGTEFLNWLREITEISEYINKAENEFYWIGEPKADRIDIINNSASCYKIISQHTCKKTASSYLGLYYHKIILLSRIDIEVPERFQKINSMCAAHSDEDDKCQLM